MDALSGLEQALDKERPDLAIYLAGADPHVNDVLGDFSLTMQGLARRDEHVVSTVRRLDIPLAVVLAGGYPQHLEEVADIHAQTARILAALG